MKLPETRALTNHDLIKYVKILKIPHFRGVFMRDVLPKKSRKIECWILNHDSVRSTGTHWTALAKINNTAWYFDSFGNLLPPLEVKTYLGRNVKILLNYKQYQSSDTQICGHLCLKFLDNFWRGINMETFL